jgi:hypothetical protein
MKILGVVRKNINRKIVEPVKENETYAIVSMEIV